VAALASGQREPVIDEGCRPRAPGRTRVPVVVGWSRDVRRYDSASLRRDDARPHARHPPQSSNRSKVGRGTSSPSWAGATGSASRRTDQRPLLEASGCVVLVVGDVVAPRRSAGGHGEVRHEVVGRRAVLVLLPRRRPDDVADADGHDWLAPGLHATFALGDVEVLSAVVAVPSGAGVGVEVDGGDVERRLVVWLDEAVDPHVTRKPLCRPSLSAASAWSPSVSLSSLLGVSSPNWRAGRVARETASPARRCRRSVAGRDRR
jgi:hypothetical protein